jgi:glycosyltransferase involved in cell wall biosynthesis
MEKNSLPKISIVVPSKNKKKFIAKTLDSLAKQNYPNLEVIIVDKSDDGSLKVIEKFQKKYPKLFKLIKQKDSGQLNAVNLGMNKAKGEILSYLNADDVLEKNALSRVGKAFRDEPKLLWLTGFGKIINEKDQSIYPWVTIYKNLFLLLNKFYLLLIVNYLTQSSTFISKKAYQRFGPFKGVNQIVLEYDLWLKIGKKQSPKIIKHHLSSFRLNQESLSLNFYQEILNSDLLIAKKSTKNQLLLLLHKINNLIRIWLAKNF